MQQKYGRNHFDFLSDSFTIPEEREALVAAMERRPDSYWIVKPPGGSMNSVASLHFGQCCYSGRQEQRVRHLCDQQPGGHSRHGGERPRPEIHRQPLPHQVAVNTLTIFYLFPFCPDGASLTSAFTCSSPGWIPSRSTSTTRVWSGEMM